MKKELSVSKEKLEKLNKTIEEKEGHLHKLDKQIEDKEKEFMKPNTFQEELNIRDKQIEALKTALEESKKKIKYLREEKKKGVQPSDGEVISNQVVEEDKKDDKPDDKHFEEKREDKEDSQMAHVENNVSVIADQELSHLSNKVESKEKEINNLNAIMTNMKEKNKVEEIEKVDPQVDHTKILNEKLDQQLNLQNEKITSMEKDHNDMKEDYQNKIINLNKEKTFLEEKVMKMKQSVMEIKTKLDTEIHKKFENKDFIIRESKMKLELNEKHIENLTKDNIRLKKYEENSRMIRLKYNESLKEKMELEELVIQQEERIDEVSKQASTYEENLKEKISELKNSESSCLSLIKVIDEQKKNIKNLQAKLKKREEEDNQRKMQVIEKEQEVQFLKNFINSLKNDSQMKERNLSQVKNKLTKAKDENTKLNTLIQSVEFKQKNLSDFDKLNLSPGRNKNRHSAENISQEMLKDKEHNPFNKKQNKKAINNPSDFDVQDENLKEITILMKKILED